jgi:hypothetical protein
MMLADLGGSARRSAPEMRPAGGKANLICSIGRRSIAWISESRRRRWWWLVEKADALIEGFRPA